MTFKRNTLFQELVKRDGQCCHYCKVVMVKAKENWVDNGMSVDHVIPKSQGGSDDMDNLVLACRKCNRAKYTKHYQEYRLGKEMDVTLLFLMEADND